MQQRFATRQISVRDFEEWHDKGQLVLAAKFQRRDVWSSNARSYLMDTIIRGKPIPKIYMRQDINRKTRRTIREIVDGQQRLRAVLSFVKDGFTISRTHNVECAGKHFSELDEDTQGDILKYEFVVDLLQDMPDEEVYDIFARLNTYSLTLNAQELRNARYFGEFKTSVYDLAREFMAFWEKNRIFPHRKILRMAEVEFVSELLIAMSIGIQGKSKRAIDKFYEDHEDQFARRGVLEKRFRETVDVIGAIMDGTLLQSRLSEPRLLYSLFCAVYHMRFGLRDLDSARVPFKPSDYAALRVALAKVDNIFSKFEEESQRQGRLLEGEPKEDVYPETRTDEETGEVFDELLPEERLSTEERAFHTACIEHWVHAENRRTRTRYICKLIVDALRE